MQCAFIFGGFAGDSYGKESVCSAEDSGSVCGSGRSPKEGNGYPLQYSCLEHSMDCIVHGVTKSWTWLSDKREKTVNKIVRKDLSKDRALRLVQTKRGNKINKYQEEVNIRKKSFLGKEEGCENVLWHILSSFWERSMLPEWRNGNFLSPACLILHTDDSWTVVKSGQLPGQCLSFSPLNFIHGILAC